MGRNRDAEKSLTEVEQNLLTQYVEGRSAEAFRELARTERVAKASSEKNLDRVPISVAIDGLIEKVDDFAKRQCTSTLIEERSDEENTEIARWLVDRSDLISLEVLDKLQELADKVDPRI